MQIEYHNYSELLMWDANFRFFDEAKQLIKINFYESFWNGYVHMLQHIFAPLSYFITATANGSV